VQRLKRPIDVLQLHWAPPFRWQESAYLKAFDGLVESKYATQLGVSNYGPQNLKRILSLTKESRNQIKTNQVQFSLMSRYPITNGLADICQESGIQLIGAYKAYLVLN
jgi:diketogulonate reductase-like aldo/keto reductase